MVKLIKPPRTDKNRWMAYAINMLLVWLLQDYLELTAAQLEGAREISRYIVFHYAECWFKSTFFTEAALLNIHTFKCLDLFGR